MIRGEIELRFTQDSPVVQGYGLVLLHDFHALRYPKQYLEEPMLGPLAVPDSLLEIHDAGAVMPKPELDLLDPTISPADKACIIRGTARPVLEYVAQSYNGWTVSEALVHYCQTQKRRGKNNLDLRDEDGKSVPAWRILPSPNVIAAMHRDWNQRHIGRCYPLEQFIGELLARV